MAEREVGLKELQEQNKLLREQIELLRELLLQGTEEPQPKPEKWLVVRSNITGHTSIIHPDMRLRRIGGNVPLLRFSEVVLPLSWRDSPNLATGEAQGIWTVREVDERPEKLLAEPDVPADSDVLDPMHRQLARDVALLGADSDEGDVYTYPVTVQRFLMTDLRRGEGRGGVDVELMQDVVRPVYELAYYLEEHWRGRKWVLDLLDERINHIINLTRRR